MIAGRCTLEREIGRGGAGIVPLAHDEVLGRSPSSASDSCPAPPGTTSLAPSARHDIQADPRALTTSYTIDFVTTSGRTVTQQVQLQLERRGDQYLIAG